MASMIMTSFPQMNMCLRAMITRIWYFSLGLGIICQIVSLDHSVYGYQGDFNSKIQKICSEEKLMLKSGVPWPMVSRMMNDEIKKLASSEMRSFSSSSPQTIKLGRDTQVGTYGQAVKVNILGNEQATISSSGTATIDETNHHIDGSELKALKFSSRPSVSVGKKLKNANAVQEVPVEHSDCEEKVLHSFERAIRSENSGNHMANYHSSAQDIAHKSSVGITEPKEAPNFEFHSGTSIEDKTSIKPRGYNVDVAQIASGNSQNSFSAVVADEQSHSTYKGSKISQINISATSRVNL